MKRRRVHKLRYSREIHKMLERKMMMPHTVCFYVQSAAES
jgi:hypothetical protein